MMSTIRFLRFPAFVNFVILRCMDVIDLISFSFCSKVAKRHAAAIKLKAAQFSVSFYNSHSISVLFPEHANPLEVVFFGKDNNQTNTLEKPVSVDVSLMGMPGGRYSNQDFEIRDWIEHFSLILNSSVIKELHISNDHFDALAIKNVLGGLSYNSLIIMPPCSVAHCQRCLEILPPKILSFVSRDAFDVPSHFMVQNMEAFNSASSEQLKLDDLLISNFKQAHFQNVSLNGRALNAFLKNWIEGSNPRLQHMRMVKARRDETWDLDTIMRGVKYKVKPAELRRRYEKCEFRVGRIHSEEFTGGFDIARWDGTRATILLNNENDICRFDIIVWTNF